MKKEEKDGKLYLEGVVLKPGESYNGSMITAQAIESAFEHFQKHNAEGIGLYGSLNYREGAASVTHVVDTMAIQDDGSLWARCFVFDTPEGERLKKSVDQFIEKGCEFGIQGIVLEREGKQLKKIQLRSVSILDPRKK